MSGPPAARLALVLAIALAGCQDYEQRARTLGHDARPAAERGCPAADGGVPEAAFGVDDCVSRACVAACTPAGAPSFQRVCVNACAARACDRDADCGPGRRCVAIAPVARRCAPRVGPEIQ